MASPVTAGPLPGTPTPDALAVPLYALKHPTHPFAPERARTIQHHLDAARAEAWHAIRHPRCPAEVRTHLQVLDGLVGADARGVLDDAIAAIKRHENGLRMRDFKAAQGRQQEDED